jgi:hypothetical protein
MRVIPDRPPHHVERRHAPAERRFASLLARELGGWSVFLEFLRLAIEQRIAEANIRFGGVALLREFTQCFK